MKQRIGHYDIISAIMLLFMMHHHICGACGLMDDAIHMVPYKVMYFYLAYFFYKAGIFYHPEKSLKEVCINSAKRLLMPFVIFTAIGYVLFGAHQLGFSPRELEYWWWPLRQVFAIGRVEGNGPLWFLLSLFIVRIIFQCTRGNKWIQSVLILLCAIIAIVGNHYSIRPRTISNVALGLFFYGLGYLLRDVQYEKRVGIASMCFFIGAYVWMSILGWHLIDFSFNTTVYGIHPIWMINCALACVAINYIGPYIPQLHILPWIGRNSMTFLCVHALIYEGLHTFVYPHTTLTDLQMLGVDWLCTLFLCSTLVIVFKNKYISWMIGEKKEC